MQHKDTFTRPRALLHCERIVAQNFILCCWKLYCLTLKGTRRELPGCSWPSTNEGTNCRRCSGMQKVILLAYMRKREDSPTPTAGSESPSTPFNIRGRRFRVLILPFPFLQTEPTYTAVTQSI